MGSLSDYAENKIVDHLLGVPYTPVATVYLRLSTADILDDGSGMAEPSGGSYAAEAIAFNAAATRKVSQTSLIEFATATGAWGTITHWGIYDASTAGNLLAHGDFTTGKLVTSGKTFSVAAGEVEVSMNSGGLSNYAVHKMYDLMFRNQAYTAPTIYVALVETTEIVDADTGITIDELDMTGYAREAHANWTAASGGAADNDVSIIDFGVLTGTGETITAACLCDNATKGAGEVLFYGNSLNQVIDTDDSVEFAIGAFDVSLS